VNIVYSPQHKKLRNSADCYHNSLLITDTNFGILGYGKSKAVPLQALTCPEGSRNLRFPDFMTKAQDGGILGYNTLYFGGVLPKLNTVKEADHKM